MSASPIKPCVDCDRPTSLHGVYAGRCKGCGVAHIQAQAELGVVDGKVHEKARTTKSALVRRAPTPQDVANEVTNEKTEP